MELHERIIEQASAMFFKGGIKSITMDDIAESLGISKRTLYEKFSTKDDLIIACIEHFHKKKQQANEVILREAGDDPIEIISRHLKHALIFFSSIHPNFFTDLKKYHPALFQRENSSRIRETVEFTAKLIDQGIKRKIFRDDINADIMSKAAHSFYRVILYQDSFTDLQYQHTEVFIQVTMCLLRGMATPAGLQIIDEKFGQKEDPIQG